MTAFEKFWHQQAFPIADAPDTERSCDTHKNIVFDAWMWLFKAIAELECQGCADKAPLLVDSEGNWHHRVLVEGRAMYDGCKMSSARTELGIAVEVVAGRR